jgi:PAS domain S-box-containing protein
LLRRNSSKSHFSSSPDETLLKALYGQSDLIVIRLDSEGNVLEWPDGARQLLGWHEDRIRGNPAKICLAEEDRETLGQRVHETSRCDGEGAATLLTGEGEFLPGGGRLLPYRGGKEILMIVNDRRTAAASERWLRWSRSLISVLGGSTLVLDPGGWIREIGAGWLPEGPHRRPEWLGRHAGDLFGGDRREVIAALRSVARDGEWSGRLSMGGDPIPVRFRTVRDDSGGLEAIVGARLPGDPGETRELFRNIPVAMLLVDREFRISEINAELEAMVGPDILPEKVLGLDIRSLGIFQTRPIQAALDNLLESGVSGPQEVHLKGTPETTPLVQLRGQKLTGEGGIITGYVIMLLTHTEKSRVERQLLCAQKMESIGNFASGLAHDFGNFVSVILGKAGVLRVKLPDDPHITGDLDDIETTAKRAQHLAQELMKFARGGRSRVASLDINALIEEVGSLIRTSVGKRIEVNLRLGEGILPVNGDTVELQQMVLNLCLNARDAMPDGGRLTIQTKALTEAELSRLPDSSDLRGGVRLIVEDSGMGMATDVAERVFEPFFTTKEDAKGTGLGLAMVYSIVRRHGGTVDVRSQPEVGTTFEIALPAAAASIQPADRPRILVVDDEPAFREMIRLIIEEDGHQVLLAASGIEALRTLRSEYDTLSLVILDLRMPGVDGLAVLEELRGLAPGLPVLVTTGYASDEEKTSALSRGAQMVLEKPYRVTELRAALAELLQAGQEAKSEESGFRLP